LITGAADGSNERPVVLCIDFPAEIVDVDIDDMVIVSTLSPHTCSTMVERLTGWPAWRIRNSSSPNSFGLRSIACPERWTL